MSPLSEALRRRSAQPVEPTFDRLLGAGRAMFSDVGYAATSLDAVAAAAGVTKGSLYHHFKSKRELFEAVFEDESRAFCDRLGAVVATGRDPRQAVYAGIDAFLDGSQDPAIQRILILDAPSVLGWERVREIEAEYGLALMQAAIEALVDDGEVVVLAHLLFGALSEGAMFIARADDAEAARRKVGDEMRRLIGGLV